MYSFFTLSSVDTACSEQVLYALSRLTGAESPDVYIHLYLNHMFVSLHLPATIDTFLATYTLLLLAVYNPTLLANTIIYDILPSNKHKVQHIMLASMPVRLCIRILCMQFIPYRVCLLPAEQVLYILSRLMDAKPPSIQFILFK